MFELIFQNMTPDWEEYQFLIGPQQNASKYYKHTNDENALKKAQLAVRHVIVFNVF